MSKESQDSSSHRASPIRRCQRRALNRGDLGLSMEEWDRAHALAAQYLAQDRYDREDDTLHQWGAGFMKIVKPTIEAPRPKHKQLSPAK